jgi:iron complex outermembrane receptor protein
MAAARPGSPIPAILVLVTFFVPVAVYGSSEAGPSEERQEAWDPELLLDEILVEGRRESPLSGKIHGRRLTSNPTANLGEAIALLPGINAVRRGAKNFEPVIRGLGWERVHTEVGCVPIYGACPARMDPPATYIAPHAIETVEVIKGLRSVADGPGGIGGGIRIPSDFERPAGTPNGFHGFFGSAFDAARSGIRVESIVRGGRENLDLRLSGSWVRFEDYESPDGITVPAGQEEIGLSANLGWRPAAGHRIWQAIDLTRGDDVAFPSLPMDSRETEFLVYNTGYRFETGRGFVRRLTVEAGVASIDHFMDNAKKPNRSKLLAQTPSEARTYSGRIRCDLSPPGAMRFVVGFDASRLDRDATRRREIVASGDLFHDHLWPEARQANLGAFLEIDRRLQTGWELNLGGRLGRTDSDARAADDRGLGGFPIRDHYARYYGEDASEVKRTEMTYGARSAASWRASRRWSGYFGFDLSTRPAGITERFFAFGPAPGGFQVGDPSLEMERKAAIEAGIDLQTSILDIGLSLYHHWVDDFILSTTIEIRDVNGDGTEDRIRGFENVHARLHGLEIAMQVRPSDRVSLPVTLALVEGRNRSADRPLPEIPPLEGSAAIRTRWGAHRRVRIELGTRFAAAQNDADREFGEDETAAWATVRLEGAVGLLPRLRLKSGVENLLDARYHEHLTREALLPVGDLLPNGEIPAPGRSFYALLEFDR